MKRHLRRSSLWDCSAELQTIFHFHWKKAAAETILPATMMMLEDCAVPDGWSLSFHLPISQGAATFRSLPSLSYHSHPTGWKIGLTPS